MVLVVVIVVLSFLLGYPAYPLGNALERVVPRKRHRNVREEFLRRVPAAKDRAFVAENPHLLLSGLQLHDKEVAIAAIVEIFTGKQPFIAAACAVLFVLASLTLVSQGRKLAYWATLKTLGLCRTDQWPPVRAPSPPLVTFPRRRAPGG